MSSLPRAWRSTPGFSSLLRGQLSFSHLLLRLASHLHERIDKVVDCFMPFCLAPHPHQSVEEIINGFSLFFHGYDSARTPASITSFVSKPAEHARGGKPLEGCASCA